MSSDPVWEARARAIGARRQPDLPIPVQLGIYRHSVRFGHGNLDLLGKPNLHRTLGQFAVEGQGVQGRLATGIRVG